MSDWWFIIGSVIVLIIGTYIAVKNIIKAFKEDEKDDE